MAALDSTLPILRQRYQALQQYNDSHSRLLEDLIAYSQRLEAALHSETSTLQRELANCRLDLDDAKTSRRNFQQQVQTYETQVQQLAKDNDDHKNRHPYVAVLIDGDGLLFQESFIRDGLEGGKRAAHALRAAVAGKCGDLASKMEIVVKVCANLSGLASAMYRSGSISNENLFKQFTLGFNQAKASFDFIDVGFGKERADSKIREDARWHLNNVNCHLVALGISHDSGYAPFLDELSSDRATRNRLSIIEGVPTVRELVATNIEIVNFNDTVFRSVKIQVDRNGAATVATVAAAATLNGNGAGRTSPVSVDSARTNSIVSVGSHSDDTRAKAAQGPKSSAKGSYAAASISSPPAHPVPVMKFPSSTTKSLQAKAAAAANAAAALVEKSKPTWSPGERGFDPPTTYNAVAIDSVKKRKGKDKFCNVYVITGNCTKDYCEYNHKLKITPDEKKALIYLMRQSPCTFGQDCKTEQCIYGHHCPSTLNGNCLQPFCRFPSSMHPPKTKFKQPFLGDN